MVGRLFIDSKKQADGDPVGSFEDRSAECAAGEKMYERRRRRCETTRIGVQSPKSVVYFFKRDARVGTRSAGATPVVGWDRGLLKN